MGLLNGGIKNIVGNALSGIFLDFTLIKTAITEPTPGEPVEGAETEYSCKAAVMNFNYMELKDEAVRAEDRKILILANSITVCPEIGDELVLSGETRRYEIVSRVKKDAAGATFICHGR